MTEIHGVLTNKVAVGVLIGVALAAMCQDRPVTVPLPKASPSLPRFEKGTIEGRTYKNASVGLEFTPTAKLKFRTPELRPGRGGTPGAFVTVAAWGEEKWLSARDIVTFWADALANYPDNLRSTQARMQNVVQDNRKAGFEPLGGSEQAELGGVAFVRADFKKGAAHEAVFVKSCSTQALVFIFFGADRKAVDDLVASTELKLSPISGCDSKATGVANK